MRIFRALQDEKVHYVRAICTIDDIPKAFAFKIYLVLEEAGFLKSERGNQGGYLLNRKLEDLTMYDVISVTEGDLAILHCMKEECNRNPESMPCKVHQEIERIQKILIEELKKKTIGEIMEEK